MSEPYIALEGLTNQETGRRSAKVVQYAFAMLIGSGLACSILFASGSRAFAVTLSSYGKQRTPTEALEKANKSKIDTKNLFTLQQDANWRERRLFTGGHPHHSYRIPAIAWVGGNRLLAFAEGRKNCNGDSGDIDLVYKVSDDNGHTWSSLRYLAGTNDKDTWGNPTAVFEKPWVGGPVRGRVHVFLNWNRKDYLQFNHKIRGCPYGKWRKTKRGDRQTYYVFSDDAGDTWSVPQNLTSSLLPPDFGFDIVGPGVGIQKQFGPKKGALIVPASSRNFISSDHGVTWTWVHVTSARSGHPSMKYPTSETTIAECSDGKLYRNDRPVGGAFKQKKRRWVLHMDDAGVPSKLPFLPDQSLLDPRSEGSMISYTKDLLIFLNSASTVTRRKMMVHLSTDCGASWKRSKWLYADPGRAMRLGKGGYSSMTKTGDFHVGALSEANNRGHGSIDFVKFNLDWLCGNRFSC